MLSKNEVKYIQSLKAKKQRLEANAFVVEGHKTVLELLAHQRWMVQALYGTETFLQTIPKNLTLPAKTVTISQEDLERISFLQTPQSCLAVVALPAAASAHFPANNWSLLLDDIQDPGNLGTIIRIADWFGIEHIFATEHTADVYNPKVIQASMGGFLRVQMHYGPCAVWLQQQQPVCYIADMHGHNVWQLQQPQPGVLVIGNEGNGVSEHIAAFATQTISIPKLGAAESLNAGVATGILLSHLLQSTNKA